MPMEIKVKEALEAKYGTADVDAIVSKKQNAEKQFTEKALGPGRKVELTDTECKKLCDKIKVEYLPGYEQRVLSYRITDETPDRYGDIVQVSGADFTTNYYPNNPVVFLQHNSYSFPVGNSIKVWKESNPKGINAWGLFLDNRVDDTGRSDLTFKFAAGGWMKTASIGFMPKKGGVYRPDAQEREKLGMTDWGVIFKNWELLEWSPVGVPANPNALQNALQDAAERKMLSIFSPADIAVMEKSKFMDGNLLDMFDNYLRGYEVGRTVFSAPSQILDAEVVKELPISGDEEAGVMTVSLDDEVKPYVKHILSAELDDDGNVVIKFATETPDDEEDDEEKTVDSLATDEIKAAGVDTVAVINAMSAFAERLAKSFLKEKSTEDEENLYDIDAEATPSGSSDAVDESTGSKHLLLKKLISEISMEPKLNTKEK